MVVSAIALPVRAVPPAVTCVTICGRVLSFSSKIVPFGIDAHISLNAKSVTVSHAGLIIGIIIRQNIRRYPAPSIFAASSRASGT